MKQKSLKKNAFFNILKTVMSLLFPLITFPYASRVLLPEGIGKVQFAQSIIGYFSIIASLGITTYAIREAAKVRDNKEQLSKFVQEMISINMVSTGIAYVLLVIALQLPLLRDYKALLIICSATLFLTTIGIDWLYAALEDFQYITLRSIFFQLLSAVLLFTCIKTNEDYLKYAVISIISSTGSNLLNFFHARRFVTLPTKTTLELKKHLKPILILFVTSIAINIFTMLDTSMLGFLTTPAEVGYYSAAVKIVRMIRDLFPAVFTVLFARLAYYVAHNETDELLTLSKKMLDFIFFFAPPMTVGLAILMPAIVSLLCGDSFLPAIATARVMTPLLIISAYSGFLGGQILVALHKEKTYMYCMIFAAVADIILNFMFIPRFGALGAAIATVLAEFFIFCLYTVLLRDFLAKIHLKKHILQCFLAAAIMGIIVYGVARYIPHRIIKIILAMIVGIAVYSLQLLFLKNTFMLAFVEQLKRITSRRLA